MCKSVLRILAVWLLSLCLNVVTTRLCKSPLPKVDTQIFVLHSTCYDSSLSIYFCVSEYSDNCGNSRAHRLQFTTDMDTGSANCGTYCGSRHLHSGRSSVSWTKAYAVAYTHMSNKHVHYNTQTTYIHISVPSLPTSTYTQSLHEYDDVWHSATYGSTSSPGYAGVTGVGKQQNLLDSGRTSQ